MITSLDPHAYCIESHLSRTCRCELLLMCDLCDMIMWTWIDDYAYMWILVIICNYAYMWILVMNVNICLMMIYVHICNNGVGFIWWLIHWALLHIWTCEIDLTMLFTWLCKVWWIPLIVAYSLFLIILFHNDVNSHPSVWMTFYALSLRYQR